MTSNPVGTMVYLSPEARIAVLTTGSRYNPFRSDVYSLGITVLHAALLDLPEELSVMDGLEARIQAIISSLSYSDKVKGILRRMLVREESQRATVEEVVGMAEDALQRVSLDSPLLADSPLAESRDSSIRPATTEEAKSPDRSLRHRERREDRKISAVITARYYQLFDGGSFAWRRKVPLRETVNCNSDSVVTFVKAGRMFLCGGGNRPCTSPHREQSIPHPRNRYR